MPSALSTLNADSFKALEFRNIGPATMGGRIDDIAVVESDPRIIYAGSAAGGIFKSVNGGNTWQSVFDEQSNPSIGDIAISPSNPSILYVGTGNSFGRIASVNSDSILALNMADGKIVWRSELPQYNFDVAIGCSPVIYQDTVLQIADQNGGK